MQVCGATFSKPYHNWLKKCIFHDMSQSSDGVRRPVVLRRLRSATYTTLLALPNDIKTLKTAGSRSFVLLAPYILNAMTFCNLKKSLKTHLFSMF